MANLYLCSNGGVKGLTLEKMEVFGGFDYTTGGTTVGSVNSTLKQYFVNNGLTELKFTDVLDEFSLVGNHSISISGSNDGIDYVEISKYSAGKSSVNREFSLLDSTGKPYSKIEIVFSILGRTNTIV